MERLLFFLFPIFFLLLFFRRGQGGGRAKGHDRGCREGDGGGLLRCPASSFYLLYWYKSTNTDAEAGGAEDFLAKDPTGLITDESVQVF
jgi:hypothetical protein